MIGQVFRLRLGAVVAAAPAAFAAPAQMDWQLSSLPQAHKKAVVSVDRATYFDETSKREVTLIVSASLDGTAIVWDLESRSARFTLVHSADGRALERVRASLDGRKIATAGMDGFVRVWDTTTGQKVAELRGHGGSVRDVAWAADGRRLASCDDRGNIIVWDLQKAQMAFAYTIASDPTLISLDITNDGSRLAVASRGNRLYLYEVESGERRVVDGLRGEPKSLRYAPGDRRIAIGEGKSLVVRDARSGARLATLERHRGAIRGLRWSDDARRVFTAGDQGEVFEWEVDTGAVLRRAKVLQSVNDLAVYGGLGQEELALAKPSSRVELLQRRKQA